MLLVLLIGAIGYVPIVIGIAAWIAVVAILLLIERHTRQCANEEPTGR